MKHEILIVDDEVDNVDALERLFRKTYKVHRATSGKEALNILKDHPDVALILSDQRMPEMTGVQLLKKSITTHPNTMRILLTGYTDVKSIVGSINSGEVYRYLNKPWDPVDLHNTIDKAVEKFSLRQELVHKNQQLEKALEELKSLDQAKTNFMILINHELKTPLTVITSFLDLLKESNIDEEQQMYVNRIDKSRQRLQTMIDSSLELISAETGQVPLKTKKIDIGKFTEDIKSDFTSLNNGNDFNLAVTADETSLKMDGSIVRNVLKKLMENAIKFSKDSKDIELKINAGDDSCSFSLKNQGPSLDKKTIDKILKPFSLDEDIMNHSQGLGLGLSTCQALLKVHNSELQIESKKNQFEVKFEIRK